MRPKIAGAAEKTENHEARQDRERPLAGSRRRPLVTDLGGIAV